MSSRNRRPSWWQLWLLFPVLGILAFLEAGASLSPAGHRLLEIGIVLVVFGSVALWLRAHEASMLRETRDRIVLYEASDRAGFPLQAGPTAGGNGNGHRSERAIPAALPESGIVYGDVEKSN